MASKYRRLYLGRKNNSAYPDDCPYQLGTRKKDWNKEEGFSCSLLAEFCPEEFEAVTGVVLEPGKVRRIDIEIKFLD